MSKHLFELMAHQQVATSNFLPNKKEIEFSSKEFAKKLIDSGELDKHEAFAQAERLTLAVTSVRDEFKANLPREKYVGFGLEINPINGRSMIQYNEDLVWSELKEQMQQREELLKVALKSDNSIYDSEGCEVPKVSVKYASDSLTVKY
jgi:hypothetical protein